MSVNKSADRALFRQIADVLAEEIRAGKYKAGERLPSEAQMMRQYDTSRLTVRRALGVLSNEEGLIDKVKGVGAFVRQPSPIATIRPSDRFRSGRAPLYADEGPTPIQEVYEIGEVPAPAHIAMQLRIDEGVQVFVRRRSVSLGDGTPMQLADSYIPRDLVTAELRDHTTSGITYATIESFELHIGILRERLSFRMPSADESRDLQLEPGTPVIDLVRTAYATPRDEARNPSTNETAQKYMARSRPVECFTAVMAGDKHVFEYILER